MTVSIIIPTTGTPDRRSSLLRAIQSILDQDSVDVVPIVVLNGERYDADLFDLLKVRRDIRFFYLDQPSLPAAINFGRRQVETSFFGFVDDDDLYQPWAVAERLDAFKMTPEADAVVSWGFREVSGGQARVPSKEIWNRSDSLRALVKGCWLASCSGLFKTATISEHYFDPGLRHLEWTSVAIRIALDRSIVFLDSERPHFLIGDSPESLSKSSQYLLGMERSLDLLLKLPLPPSVRRGFVGKKMSLRHDIADYYRIEGDLGNAWKHHIRTFYHLKGLRYLPSTVHLLRATLSQLSP